VFTGYAVAFSVLVELVPILPGVFCVLLIIGILCISFFIRRGGMGASSNKAGSTGGTMIGGNVVW
jgi:hypothetical protein